MALTKNYASAGIFAVNREGKSLRQLCKAADSSSKEIDRLVMSGMTRNEAMAYRSRQDQARRAAKKAKRKTKLQQRKTQQPRSKTVWQNKPRAPAGLPQRIHYRKGLNSHDFYRCWEWQTLRYQIIKRYGPKCMCCGAQGNHVDHIKPRSKYPGLELDPENLQVLCEPCNVGKSNLYEDDWRTKGL